MRTYKIKVKFTYTGEVTVKADTKAEAVEIVNTDFNNTLGEIGTGLSLSKIKCQ